MFNKRVQCKTVEEFNKYLKIAKEIAFKIHYEKYNNQPLKQDAWFEESPRYFRITFKLLKRKVTYFFDRNGDYVEEPDVIHILSELGRINPVQKICDYMPQYKFNTKEFQDGKAIGYRQCIGSASPIRDSNTQYRNKATYAYEYDLVSAYGQMLRDKLPDLSTVQYNTVVKEGQVGFYQYGSTLFGYPQLRMTTTVGFECDWVFNLMDSPYQEWCDKIFKELSIEKDEVKRNRLKNKFRIFVGQLQTHNPFWRAYIVERCNKVIKEYLNEDAIYWSTDSVVTTRKIDIDATGYKWKVKNEGLFKLKGRLDQQWNLELPVVNGIYSRYIRWYNMTHKEPFDLLKDQMPTFQNSYYILNKDTFQLEVNKEIGTYEC